VSANPKNPSLDIAKPGVDLAPTPARTTHVVPSHEALQALLAFSSLHEQIRQRREREKHTGEVSTKDVWELEQFVLDEVLQLVSDRALAITGADGVAIALADGDAIVCRASSGKIAPDAGVRLDPNAGFSGACLTSGHIIRCDDSENDSRVNVQTCRNLGARSMVAVPLSARKTVIGLLETFSSEAFGFNDSDVRSLILLAELILAALKPEEEDRLAEISQRVVVAVAAPMAAQSSASQVDQDPEILASIPELGVPEVPVTGEVQNLDSDDSEVVDPMIVEPTIVDPMIVEPMIVEPMIVEPMIVETTIAEPVIAAVPIPDAPVERVEPGRLINHPPEENEVPEMFPETIPAEKSRVVRVMLPLALAGLAAVGGLWWKLSHHSAETSHQVVSAAAPTTTSASSPADLDYTPATPLADKSGSEKGSAVTGIRHWSAADSSTVVIDLQDQVQYEAHRLSDPERIYFDLHDTALAADLANKSIAVQDALLVRIRAAQPVSGITRIVLETKVASDYSVSLEQNPYRLVVEIRKLGSKPQPRARVDLFGPSNPHETIEVKADLNTPSLIAPVPAKTASPTSLATNVADPASTAPHVPQFRLVLDAGHGGWDLGTVGRKGLMEKDLVLDIVDRLGKLVQSKLGAEVIYTRQDDTYIPLEKRAEIANVAHADLFLSIHANYSDYPSARGVETYYTNTYSSLKARTPGADATDSTLQNINWTNVDIREKVQESHRFAASVQRSLYGNLSAKNPGLRDRGVKAASYVVLTGTEMPAILAEVSFVSSPTDESELQRSAYRQQIAEALYQGLSRYAEASHKVKLASASAKPAR
jgi:N-acetylmuramoyl-L-alanine amidase